YSLVDIESLEYCIREELNRTATRRVAILDPVKVTVTNYPEDKKEYFELPNHPGDPERGTRKVPFTRTLFIDRDDFSDDPPPKFFRMKPGGEVRLMGSYIVKCDEVKYSPDGKVEEILVSADLETRDGMPTDGRKVKGTIHWLSSENADHVRINHYDRLFTLKNTGDVPEGIEIYDFLNPDSLAVYENALVEGGVKDAKDERFQFVRLGYYYPDAKNPGTFLRIVSLKDSYKPE
ncbi:MAG: glutamine--tRNA ligase, partial [Clostridia bacterium]|nr:glutamine--tRNA ligase [Clostridia bacterium]